jgi:hypothetical protein
MYGKRRLIIILALHGHEFWRLFAMKPSCLDGDEGKVDSIIIPTLNSLAEHA